MTVKYKGQKIDKELILDRYFDNKERFGVKVGLHLLFWALCFNIGWFIHFKNFPNISQAEWVYYQLNYTLNLIVFYLLSIQFKRGQWTFIITLTFILVPVYIVSTKLFFEFSHSFYPQSQYISIWRLNYWCDSYWELFTVFKSYRMAFSYNAAVIFIFFVIKFLLTNIEQNELNQRKLEENLELELSFLRSQVNPHFLFNTLNNIYGQALSNEKATLLIISLSKILRYSFHTSEISLVPLSKELDIARQYCTLLDVFLKRNKPIEIIGNQTSNRLIPSFEIITPLDCLFIFHKYETEESCRVIKILTDIAHLDFSIWIINEFKSGEFIKLFNDVSYRLIKTTYMEKAQLFYTEEPDKINIVYKSDVNLKEMKLVL